MCLIWVGRWGGNPQQCLSSLSSFFLLSLSLCFLSPPPTLLCSSLSFFLFCVCLVSSSVAHLEKGSASKRHPASPHQDVSASRSAFCPSHFPSLTPSQERHPHLSFILCSIQGDKTPLSSGMKAFFSLLSLANALHLYSKIRV